VAIEVARGSLGAAEAALAELDNKPDALVASVEALRARKNARDGAAARLEAIEADQDLSVAAQLRRKLAMAFLVIAVLISTVIHARQYMLGEGTHASGAVLPRRGRGPRRHRPRRRGARPRGRSSRTRSTEG
jgi:hypothetical protein